jgi:hypothetical protein
LLEMDNARRGGVLRSGDDVRALGSVRTPMQVLIAAARRREGGAPPGAKHYREGINFRMEAGISRAQIGRPR